MIPNILHSGKGKTMEIVKISVVARSCGGRKDEEAEHRRLETEKLLHIIL